VVEPSRLEPMTTPHCKAAQVVAVDVALSEPLTEMR